ncbi:hypothetical protein OE88DRAFT_1736870 [Heliocybe sulcata]|uniref:Uncharacterized protein n=1 Tax=Heliocybe sulcata TaxID=5364 RepID=A0A5C3MYH5_9AGAM|nr:hypothetical protein OE88DRAFT_1736870 [Heliocybe sulcata]
MSGTNSTLSQLMQVLSRLEDERTGYLCFTFLRGNCSFFAAGQTSQANAVTLKEILMTYLKPLREETSLQFQTKETSFRLEAKKVHSIDNSRMKFVYPVDWEGLVMIRLVTTTDMKGMLSLIIRAANAKLKEEEYMYELLKDYQGTAIPFSFGIWECAWQPSGNEEKKILGVCHLTEYINTSTPYRTQNLRLWEENEIVMNRNHAQTWGLPRICEYLCKALLYLKDKRPGLLGGRISKEDVLTHEDLGGLGPTEDFKRSRAVWVKPGTALHAMTGSSQASEMSIKDFLAQYNQPEPAPKGTISAYPDVGFLRDYHVYERLAERLARMGYKIPSAARRTRDPCRDV